MMHSVKRNQSRTYVEDTQIENCRNLEMAAGNTDREHSIFSRRPWAAEPEWLITKTQNHQRAPFTCESMEMKSWSSNLVAGWRSMI